MNPDRRVALRSFVFRIGEIWGSEGSEPVDCLVRDTSLTGALIEVRTTTEVPDEFRLTVRSNGLAHACKVVRRTKHLVGVAFAD